MNRTLSDFSTLKNLLRELQEQGQHAAPEDSVRPQKNCTVRHRPFEVEPDGNAGISIGARVRMMDSSDTGTVTGIGKGFYEIELDGLVIRAVKNEFIPVDEAQDRKMYASVPSEPKKHIGKYAASNPVRDLVVDLHLERIPGSCNVPERAALEYQMSWFRKILRENLRHRGKRIVFIHGDGDGILKAAVRKELDEVFASSCTYTFGVAERYGTGATVVTVR